MNLATLELDRPLFQATNGEISSLVAALEDAGWEDYERKVEGLLNTAWRDWQIGSHPSVATWVANNAALPNYGAMSPGPQTISIQVNVPTWVPPRMARARSSNGKSVSKSIGC